MFIADMVKGKLQFMTYSTSKTIMYALPDCCNFQLRDVVLEISTLPLANASVKSIGRVQIIDHSFNENDFHLCEIIYKA